MKRNLGVTLAMLAALMIPTVAAATAPVDTPAVEAPASKFTLALVVIVHGQPAMSVPFPKAFETQKECDDFAETASDELKAAVLALAEIARNTIPVRGWQIGGVCIPAEKSDVPGEDI